MYYLTITTLIHIYLIRVYCEKKININILNVVLIFLIIILKVRVFKLLNEPFATFIFAWLIIFILAQVLIGKNTKRNLELSFLIELINFYVKNRQLTVERVRGRKELREKEKVIEELGLYIETIEELVDKFKEFRHDCKNMLLGVGLDNSKIDELVDKVDEEVKSSTNYNIFLSLKDIKYSSLKSLLYYYIMNALKQEIEVKLTVLGTIENIAMSDLEFSRILGIIFENATEAAIESHEKKIDIYIEELNGKVNIAIGNTFKGKIENLKGLPKKGFSTKGENRGIGLYILRNIIDKNPGLELETYINEEYFIQDLFL